MITVWLLQLQRMHVVSRVGWTRGHCGSAAVLPGDRRVVGVRLSLASVRASYVRRMCDYYVITIRLLWNYCAITT